MGTNGHSLSLDIDVEALLGNGALTGLGAAHVEGHAVREDPDLLEAERFVAPGALCLVADHQVGALELALLDLRVERLELRQVSRNHCVLFLCHLGVK